MGGMSEKKSGKERNFDIHRESHSEFGKSKSWGKWGNQKMEEEKEFQES